MKTVVNGKQAEIMEIETQGQNPESLIAGVSAGLLLNNIDKNDIQKGNIYFE